MDEATMSAAMPAAQEEEAQRGQLFRSTLLIGSGLSAVSLVAFVAAGMLLPQFPTLILVLNVTGFLVLSGISALLWRRDHLPWAIGVWVMGMSIGLLVTSYFFNGVTGPLAVLLIMIPVLAVLLGGWTVAWRAMLAVLLPYAIMTALEGFGVVEPQRISGVALLVMYTGTLAAALAVTVSLVGYSARLTERALVTSRERQQQLAESGRQAERAAQAEREAREREVRIADQLRQVVGGYSAFLRRVSAGDYEARLELPEMGEGRGVWGELRALGGQLIETVEALVAALADLQAVQKRYVRETWGEYLTGAAHRGFRYQYVPGSLLGDPTVEAAGEAWLAPMTQAVRQQKMAASDVELALPITLRGEIVGALGARREDGDGWSEEEVALVEAIVDQLAQTIESLRLLDETQRGAARDRVVGEVATRVRESLEMETMLRTAAGELRQALGLDRVVVRLVAPEAGADVVLDGAGGKPQPSEIEGDDDVGSD